MPPGKGKPHTHKLLLEVMVGMAAPRLRLPVAQQQLRMVRRAPPVSSRSDSTILLHNLLLNMRHNSRFLMDNLVVRVASTTASNR